MKTKQFHITTFVTALLSFGLSHPQAAAAISITNFNLTTNSVSFNISGTMPVVLPSFGNNVLYFVNPNLSASPGFAFGNLTDSASRSFTGAQTLRSFLPVAPAVLGGEFFFVAFANNLTTGEAVSGLLTATWSSTVFDPTVVRELDVLWGEFTTDGGGQYLTTTSTVPEPSSTFLAAFTSLALLRRTRKK